MQDLQRLKAGRRREGGGEYFLGMNCCLSTAGVRRSSGENAWFVFGRSRFQILAWIPSERMQVFSVPPTRLRRHTEHEVITSPWHRYVNNHGFTIQWKCQPILYSHTTT